MGGALAQPRQTELLMQKEQPPAFRALPLALRVSRYVCFACGEVLPLLFNYLPCL